MDKIKEIDACQILDSRGYPTLWAKVTTTQGFTGESMVPSGASTGRYEAVELRDNQEHWLGKSVYRAVDHVKKNIRQVLLGESIVHQRQIDKMLIDLDGSENKAYLGANAILAVSMACARAGASSSKVSLYRYLAELIGKPSANILPMPMLNILNGGAHADNTIDFQEFMIRPIFARSIEQALEGSVTVYHQLKNILRERHLSTGIGDEGGFAPNLERDEEALDLMVEAIERCGYSAGKDFTFALDCAASEFAQGDSSFRYIEKKKKNRGMKYEDRSVQEQIDFLKSLSKKYPIDSIEDALGEDDWKGWQLLTEQLGSRMQLVGDDLLVTNQRFLQRAFDEKVANSILIKLNQIGTVSETLSVIDQAQTMGYGVVISHRSGETEDSFIADLSVATGAMQIKTGAPCRSDRIAKYNRLLLIEKELGRNADFRDGNRFS